MPVVSAGQEHPSAVSLTPPSLVKGKWVMQSLPIWVKKAVVDFIETALAAILVLTLAIPANVEQAKEVALVVGMAVLGALIAAVRRAVPGFLVWLNEKLGTNA